ncbi:MULTISPECIES: hypothetical protein [unclassified Nocardia]|uniref:hypothetical protein n=1 Tax=Nocardia sp. NPDC019255 TaxID=3154591 RepID=UPI003407D9C3
MTKAEQALEVKRDVVSEASNSAERTSVGWYKRYNDHPSGCRIRVSLFPGL